MREIAALTPHLSAPATRRIGLISLASDHVSSDEIRAVCGGADCAIHETRIPNADRITAESLAAMEAGLTEAASRLPGGLPYDAAAYLCTSASRLIGFDRVADLVREALPGASVTNPLAAAIAACEAIGARRIALVTPYVAEVTDALASGFEEAGVTVVRAASFFTDSDAEVARIDADSLTEAAAEAARPGGVDAVFLSCTALRTVHATPRFEAAAGLPVLSSNVSVAWELLRRIERRPTAGNWGRLLSTLS